MKSWPKYLGPTMALPLPDTFGPTTAKMIESNVSIYLDPDLQYIDNIRKNKFVGRAKSHPLYSIIPIKLA